MTAAELIKAVAAALQSVCERPEIFVVPSSGGWRCLNLTPVREIQKAYEARY
jgi:hypothetical protein